MTRRKRSPEENERRAKIRELLLSSNISMVEKRRYRSDRYRLIPVSAVYTRGERLHKIRDRPGYYNTQRVQRNLGVVTPMEKFQMAFAA